MTKRAVLIVAVLGLLVLGGGYFGWKLYSGGQPAFRGRAIPVKGLPEELVESWEESFTKALDDEKVLQLIVDESDYASKLEVSADGAVDHLRKAVRVRVKNSSKTIEIGLVGKRKEDEDLKGIAKVLYEKAEKKVLEASPSFQDYLDATSKN